MKAVFADTFYWVALANPRDAWHELAKKYDAQLKTARLLTTDEVLSEFLTQLGSFGSTMRLRAVNLVDAILHDGNIVVIPQSRDSFLAGLKLYRERPDKGYSLTDCISMVTMKSTGSVQALTHDVHFEQEGFEAVFRKS